MDATNRREVVVGEWTLNITASPDGAGLQVEALRRTPELDAAVIQGKGASPPEEGRVAVCVADVEGHLEPATVILPANKVWFGVGGRTNNNKRPASSSVGDDMDDATAVGGEEDEDEDDGMLLRSGIMPPAKKRQRSNSTAEATHRRPASDDEYDDEAKRAQNDDLDSDEHDVLDSEGHGQQAVPAIGSTLMPQLRGASEHVRVEGKDEAKKEDREEEMEGEVWWQPAGEHHLGFADMPTEIQLRVFSRLTPNEVITASAVCRHWRALSQDTGLWRDHVNSLYGSLEGPGAYYRDIYIQTALGMRKIQQIYAASLRKAQFCLSVRRLAFACRCGAVRWVESLLEDLTARNIKQLLSVGLPLENLTPFMIAVKHRHKGVVNLLLPYLATDDDEDDAAQLREASAMEGDGSDFTIYDRWNNLLEALTIAISIRDTDTAVVLIRAGADVAATNCFQQAIYKGDKEMVRFLLANGADKEAQLFLKDYAYVTPLIFAIEMENREIVQMLLDAGADPNTRCEHMPYGSPTRVNVTALTVAVGRCNLEMAGLLLAHPGRLERANWKEALELAKEQLLDVASEERVHLIMFMQAEIERRHAKWVTMVQLLRDYAHSAVFIDDQHDQDEKPGCFLM